MTLTVEHTMPRLRQPRFDAAQSVSIRRAHNARPSGVMTPLELRAEVLALIG